MLELKTDIMALNFKKASEILEKKLETSKDYMILSLLYQLLDDYEAEKNLLDRYKEKFGLNEYFEERLKWHRKPYIFHKFPQAPFTLPSHQRNHVPNDDVLKDLCFITCVSSNNLDFFLDNIASIQALEKYKNIPHYIVDTGLSDEECALLKEHYKHLIIKKPDLDKYPPQMKIAANRIANHAYPYFNTYTDGHRYTFHVEADIWLYDQSPIDNLLWLCLEQGCGKNDPNSGLFCTDRQAPFLETWQKMYETELPEKINNPEFKYHLQGRVMYRCYAQMKLKYFASIDQTYSHNAMVWNTGFPVMAPYSNVYRHALTMQPITCVHMHGMCKKRYGITYVPSQKRQHALISFEEFAKHVEFSRLVLQNGMEDVEIPEKYNKVIPIRYRTWSNVNKENLKNELLRVLEDV